MSEIFNNHAKSARNFDRSLWHATRYGNWLKDGMRKKNNPIIYGYIHVNKDSVKNFKYFQNLIVSSSGKWYKSIGIEKNLTNLKFIKNKNKNSLLIFLVIIIFELPSH